MPGLEKADFSYCQDALYAKLAWAKEGNVFAVGKNAQKDKVREQYRLWMQVSSNLACVLQCHKKQVHANSCLGTSAAEDNIDDIIALRVVLDIQQLAGESDEDFASRGAGYCYHALTLVRKLPNWSGCVA